jgi:uncharacterized membrane protein
MISVILGLVASIAGFCIALYIQRHQQAKAPLMCPRRSPCETVINSPQAKTLGVSNTTLGLFYYSLSFLLFAYYGTGQSLQGTLPVLMAFVSGGLIFSIYLVGVQHFKIKQWCVWCLSSAAMAALLFIAALTIII